MNIICQCCPQSCRIWNGVDKWRTVRFAAFVCEVARHEIRNEMLNVSVDARPLKCVTANFLIKSDLKIELVSKLQNSLSKKVGMTASLPLKMQPCSLKNSSFSRSTCLAFCLIVVLFDKPSVTKLETTCSVSSIILALPTIIKAVTMIALFGVIKQCVGQPNIGCIKGLGSPAANAIIVTGGLRDKRSKT